MSQTITNAQQQTSYSRDEQYHETVCSAKHLDQSASAVLNIVSV